MGVGELSENEHVVLGEKFRDVVTGFEGIATAEFRYLNGCVRVNLEAHDDKSQPVEYTFDVDRLEHVPDAGVHVDAEPSGGARPAPRRTGL